MGYELTIPLKRGSIEIEIEFDDVADLEEKLQQLDVARVEKVVAAALKPGRRAAKRPAKKAARKKAKKGAKKRGGRRAKKSASA